MELPIWALIVILAGAVLMIGITGVLAGCIGYKIGNAHATEKMNDAAWNRAIPPPPSPPGDGQPQTGSPESRVLIPHSYSRSSMAGMFPQRR